MGTFEFLARRSGNESAWWPSKGLFIWRRVTWLAELLDKGEIPAASIKVLFCRLTIYMGQAGDSPRRDLGKKSQDLG